MDEYISREAVINITAETGAWETQNRVRELPAADVQPVKHGQFEEYSEKEKYEVYKKYHRDFDGFCSECGSHMFRDDKFCADCGAKMGGDSE